MPMYLIRTVLPHSDFRAVKIAMCVERIPHRNSLPSVLLRQSFRRQGKIKKRTLANLSKWPDRTVEGHRILLKGALGPRSPLPGRRLHHSALPSPWPRRRRPWLRMPSRQRDLVTAIVLNPRSKLATARSQRCEPLAHTLGQELGIERRLAARHP